MISCLKNYNISINQDDRLLISANKNDYEPFYRFGYFNMVNDI